MILQLFRRRRQIDDPVPLLIRIAISFFSLRTSTFAIALNGG